MIVVYVVYVVDVSSQAHMADWTVLTRKKYVQEITPVLTYPLYNGCAVKGKTLLVTC